MNRGSVGFLMNEYSEHNLPERLAAALPSIIHPLIMRAVDVRGIETTARAINEVSLLRQTYQAAKFRIEVDSATRLNEIIADGMLVATPAGSTAYNLSANGPILPLGAPLMALTPLSPFRPRRWRGALLPDAAEVVIEILEADKRPVAAAADHYEIRRVTRVEVKMDRATSLILLHDPGHSLRRANPARAIPLLGGVHGQIGARHRRAGSLARPFRSHADGHRGRRGRRRRPARCRTRSTATASPRRCSSTTPIDRS